MTARDELAKVIVAAYGEDAESECPCEQDLDVADAIIAAGYRNTMKEAAEVLCEVDAERERQNAKWGEQNHPNGTGADQIMWPAVAVKTKSYGAIAEGAKEATDTAAEYGSVTYADILIEEVFEALAEEDPAKLRAELVQVAAVATQWVEAIDRGTK